ncbi:protein of unknown function [Aminobacter niigataensis]|nr:protein of unknown function [Aminobacter niigataensis]
MGSFEKSTKIHSIVIATNNLDYRLASKYSGRLDRSLPTPVWAIPMSDRWTTMLSSASHHKRLVCELYVDNQFVLLVSNEDGELEVDCADGCLFAPP